MPNFKKSKGYKMKGFSGFKSSPAKQEGPIDEKQIGLQKGEMEGTWVYGRGYDDEETGKYSLRKSERMNDLEDRIEFLTSDIEGGSDRPGQNVSDMKKAKAKLEQELAILRKSKHK
jgi:uncharacterized protein YdcH (DUF465 family)|tara:strand:- start:75 stop:422 length:348 start_codon:yes stop_codon:yes gene_type:complete